MLLVRWRSAMRPLSWELNNSSSISNIIICNTIFIVLFFYSYSMLLRCCSFFISLESNLEELCAFYFGSTRSLMTIA